MKTLSAMKPATTCSPDRSPFPGVTESGSDVIRVRLMMEAAPEGMPLFTPGGSLRWGRCQFDFNPAHHEAADFAVVLYNARTCDRFPCAPQNTLFISGEPPAKKTYPQAYYRQFHRIVDTHSQSGHPRVVETALGLPWLAGLDLNAGKFQYGYDYLTEMRRPEKSNRISVVCSNAAHTEGQRRRLAFLGALKERLGGRLVHYGRGFEPIRDKLDAIGPHRLHLVLENSESPHYWTEKLADAYLGWSLPFYAGCPNVGDYFDADSFVRLDMNDADEAARLICERLDSPVADAEIEAVSKARWKILNTYNPFAWTARWVEEFYQAAPMRDITLRSHKAFRPFPRGWLFRRFRR